MNQRIVYIDYLRIVATIMVVMIHTSGMLIQCSHTYSCAYWLAITNNAIVRSAVPLFFMISGALLLRPEYDASPFKMVRKTLKVVLVMLVWSFVYAFVNKVDISLKSIIFATIKGPFHFWFFEYLLGIYLLTPVLKIIADYRDGEIVKYFLILFIIFGIGKATLGAIPFCHKWITDVTGKVHIEMMDFVGYFFLGWYLNKTRISISMKVLVCLFVITVLMHIFITTNCELLHNTDNWWICTFVEAIVIWLVVKQLAAFNKKNNLITSCSRLAMGVFIFHPIIIYLIPNTWWTPTLYIFDMLLVLCGAFLITLFLSKIPKIKELVIL